MALNNKQRVFIDEYLICLNASEAARRAGYNGKSNVVGSQLLANISISEEITRLLKERHLSADAVLARLGEMAASNLSDFADIETYADLANARKRGYLVKKFKRKITRDKSGSEYEEVELELYDAQAALVHIGKAHGLFADRMELTGPGGAPLPFSEVVINIKHNNESVES